MQAFEKAINLGNGLSLKSFTLDYNDLKTTSGSGAKTFPLFTLPKYAKILAVNAKHSVAFAGGSLSAMTVSVGKVGTATYFSAAFDVFQAVADTTLQETAGLFKSGQESALGIIATFTPTGDNCSAATAGVVTIDVLTMNISTP